MHISVLLEEAIQGLNLKEDGIYVDCTLGYAGHSSEILKRVRRGCLFAFDQDLDAIEFSQKRLAEIGHNFTIIHSNFENIKEELAKRNINKVDGILFDLGVSSVQLDEKERGFSYHQDAPLDMRMDQHDSSKITASDIVNNYSLSELSDIFYRYGEEKYSRSIARAIVDYRKNKKIESTLELVDIIKSAMPMKAMRDKHPARRIFQALRIEVNHELDVLEKALNDSLDLLNKNGRLVVITFHSLEDRIVKNIFKERTTIDEKVKGLPEIPKEYQSSYRLINNKAILPTDEEMERNKRSRSAKLRIIERI